MNESRPGPGPIEALKADWEIFAAAGLMVLVLAALDLVSLNTPALVLSLVPFAFPIAAALYPVGWKTIAAWTAACVALAALMGDWRFASLSYSAVVIGILLAVHRAVTRARP